MELGELISVCEGAKLLNGNKAEQIFGLASDDRRCGQGYLFFCKGDAFKLQYAENAVMRGAAAIVAESKWTTKLTLRADLQVAVIEVENVAHAMAKCAAHYYGYPLRKLKTVAVTGTKGKTTTAYYINSILNQRGKYKSAILLDMVDATAPRLTTPEALDFHKAAARAVNEGFTHLVCEISSQAEKSLRTYGITFDISCFLNFGRDHVGTAEHSSTNEYFQCKAAIVQKSRKAIINIGCLHGRKLMQMLNPAVRVVTFSAKAQEACYLCKDIQTDGYGCDFLISEKNKVSSFSVFVPLVGEHNTENALCAASVAREMGVSRNEVILGLALSRPQGRSEIRYSMDKRICVVVDYAHNEMSFTAIAKAARKQLGAQTVTAVFGCPGDKAECRRYQLALACVKNAEKAIICEDDSAEEGYANIKKELYACFEKAEKTKNARMGLANVTFIENREKAINLAVKNAYENGDKEVILLLGKGAETLNRGANGDERCESDIVLAERVIDKYNRQYVLKKTLGQTYGSNSLGKTLICMSEDACCVSQLSRAILLLRQGIKIAVLCHENTVSEIKKMCFENGIAVYGLDVFSKMDMLESLIAAGILPVFYTKENAYSLASETAEKGNFSKIVYLGLNAGILVKGSPVLSRKRAKLIFSALKTVNSELEFKLSEDTSEVAILNGKSELALESYLRLGKCDGTVIKKEIERG